MLQLFGRIAYIAQKRSFATYVALVRSVVCVYLSVWR